MAWRESWILVSSKSTDFAICQGQYEKDMKNGEGVFIWPDGRSYRGQWQGHPPRQSTDLEDKGVDDIYKWNFCVMNSNTFLESRALKIGVPRGKLLSMS